MYSQISKGDICLPYHLLFLLLGQMKWNAVKTIAKSQEIELKSKVADGPLELVKLTKI